MADGISTNKTIINWVDANDELPIKDEDETIFDRIYSASVLVTDGYNIFNARYIYNWADLPDLRKSSLKWEEDFLSNCFIDVIAWCYGENLVLPERKTEQGDTDIYDKKYSLKQLRGAWGAGRYSVGQI